MLNFHVLNNPWWVCRKDMSEWQKWYQRLRLRWWWWVMINCFCGMVDRRKAFSLISRRDHCPPTRCEQGFTCAEHESRLSWMKLCSSNSHGATYNQKAFFELYLRRCLIKLYFKSILWIVLAIEYESVKVKTFVLRKILKNKQIVIPMHRFVIRLPLESDYLPKRCKTTFLHENITFIETFAMRFINKLEFWDSTAMITYFVTDPLTDASRKQKSVFSSNFQSIYLIVLRGKRYSVKNKERLSKKWWFTDSILLLNLLNGMIEP